ncbi:MAG: hypothetical protein IJY42_04595 [Clostridia bacterium]|nr:hypothetical protein [Clostridia bacterium]
MKKVSQLLSAILTLVLGIFLVIKGEGIIPLALTVFGVFLLVLAVLDFIRIRVISGLIYAILGAIVLVFGGLVWGLLKTYALPVIGILLLIYGIFLLIKSITSKKKGRKLWGIILSFIEPAICIVGALMLIVGNTVSVAILIAGNILIVDGVLALIRVFDSKK